MLEKKQIYLSVLSILNITKWSSYEEAIKSMQPKNVAKRV
jgi:hypothetical protein